MINHINIEKFNQSSMDKQIDIVYDTSNHITNDDIVSGTFSLSESGCATKELKFGSLVASRLYMKTYNRVENLLDKTINVSLVIDNDASNPVNIGKYTVVSDKPTSDRTYKEITAYDKLYNIIHANVAEWYNALSFPLSLKLFRDSFFEYFGIEQEDVELVNDGMNIERTISGDSISGQSVLSAICEINGAIGRINRNGKFAYIILNPNPLDRIKIDNIVSKSGSYEDFDTKPISKVQIRQMQGDVGAIVGEDGNMYIVQDNFLVYGKASDDLTAIASNLLSVIKGISYRPFNVQTTHANPCYEIGDAVEVTTLNSTFNSYILSRTINGIQAMKDTYKTEGVEIYTENINSTNTQITQLKRRTNELTRTVEETKSTITEIENVASEAQTTAESAKTTAETFESQITQQAKEIESKVSKTEYTGEQIASLINQTAESIKIIAEHIQLEGIITANGAFIIDENGYFHATGGTVGGFDINNGYLSAFHNDDDYDKLTSMEISATEGIKQIGYFRGTGKGYNSLHLHQDSYKDELSGFNVKYSVLDFLKLSSADWNPYKTISLDGRYGTVEAQNIKTKSGVDLDSLNNNYKNLNSKLAYGRLSISWDESTVTAPKLVFKIDGITVAQIGIGFIA